MRTKFTTLDCGCIADGTFGHGHVRETLAAWVESLGTPEAFALATELRGDGSDDASEEYDAITLLDAACEPGISFGFHEGDLFLETDEFWGFDA